MGYLKRLFYLNSFRSYFRKRETRVSPFINSLCGSGPSRSLSGDSRFSGPGLKDFIRGGPVEGGGRGEDEEVPYVDPSFTRGWDRKVYFDVYGCQMNVNDTEIVWSVLQSAGYQKTTVLPEADVILMMTCAIRDRAELKVWNKLTHYRAMKTARSKMRNKPDLKIGILGCMAERLKHQLVEKERSIDVVAGPDSYKDLPRLLCVTGEREAAVNVALSHDETYADVVPVRIDPDSVSAYVSIMRGCDNMCSYCIVPFTRGRERSRPVHSILREVQQLSDQGVKELTLLGQNVNSYRDLSVPGAGENTSVLAEGFRTVYKPKKGGLRFAELLERVASVDPEMRIRFTSPHPKDFPDEVLDVVRRRGNICSSLHLPAQSGNSDVLASMRRGYTREAYLALVRRVRDALPSVTLSSDFICGFCGETDRQFADTISLIKEVGYHVAYLFAYSMREKTTAHRRYKDDVPPEVKQGRLLEMVAAFRGGAEELNRRYIGKEEVVLVEGGSKRSDKFLAGRNDGNVKVIVPAIEIPSREDASLVSPIKPGDYISVQITEANSQVLKGIPMYHTNLSGIRRDIRSSAVQ